MKTTYALDSNTISNFLRGEGNVEENFKTEIVDSDHTYVMPVAVYYEVNRWLQYEPTKQLRQFLQEFNILYGAVERYAEMGADVWEMAVQIYIDLKAKGQLIGDSDILIAAYCIVNDYTLVTRNEKDFKRIGGLKIVNWFD